MWNRYLMISHFTNIFVINTLHTMAANSKYFKNDMFNGLLFLETNYNKQTLWINCTVLIFEYFKYMFINENHSGQSKNFLIYSISYGPNYLVKLFYNDSWTIHKRRFCIMILPVFVLKSVRDPSNSFIIISSCPEIMTNLCQIVWMYEWIVWSRTWSWGK